MKKLVIIPVLFFFAGLISQEVIQCDTATSFWVIKKDKETYTVKLHGKVIKSNMPTVLVVNKYALQYIMVDKAQFVNRENANSEQEILQTYIKSEVDYLSKVLNTKLNVSMQNAPLSKDRNVIVWSYPMPEGQNSSVKIQLFACMIIGDKIIGFGSSQFTDQTFEEVRDFLMDVISTLEKAQGKPGKKKMCTK
jgi:hypothetical protein